MLTRPLLLLAFTTSLLLGLVSAEAASRVALLIGNAEYPSAPLRNPVNDVDAMEAALKGAGFDLVLARKNLDLRGMDAAVEEFREKARGAEIAVVFYSGHGIEVEGVNYLVPKDAVLDNDRTVKREALALDDVLDAMQGATKLRLVLLDACRDNPFVSRMKRTRSAASRGLGRVDPPMSDTLIAYATAAGRTATDGEGRLSPFTSALVKHIVTPGLDVELALRRVRDEVREATRAAAARENRDPQEPYKTGSIGSTLITLNARPADGAGTVPAPAAPVVSVPVDPNAVAAADFDRAKSIGTVSAWDWFLSRHGRGSYAELARAAREKLTAPAVPPSPTQPPASRPTQFAVTVPLARPSGPVSCADRPRLVSGSARSARPLSAEEAGCLQPEDVFKECDDCPEMVVVPAGSFTMGSPSIEPDRDANEGPQRTVTIGRSFAVGSFEVTFSEWDACVSGGGCNGHRPKDEGWGRGRLPVINVSWEDAKAYVTWLSRTTSQPYRLLTEAEWEYAARGGTTTPFWWGSSIVTDQANYDGNYTYGHGWKGLYRQQTVSVDSFDANPFGLYQVHGNVWEWVEDCYVDTYRGSPSDGSAQTARGCGTRVLRGGSWFGNPGFLRSAIRFRSSPLSRYYNIGFRVARTLHP